MKILPKPQRGRILWGFILWADVALVSLLLVSIIQPILEDGY